MKIKLLLAASLILSSVANAALVAWYPLDTDASDASGNGHHGSTVGTPTFGQTGANANTGQSTAFPGTSRIDVPWSSSLNPQSFTVTLWALSNTSGGGHKSPITSRDDPGTHGYVLYTQGGTWQFWTGDGSPGWDNDGGSAEPLTPTWTHIAISYQSPADGGGATGTKRLYINGSLDFANTATNGGGTTQYSANGPQTEDLHIGSGQDDGLNFYWDGNVDDVTIWDNVLTEAQIDNIRLNSIPEPSSLGILALAGLGLLQRRRR